jgi:hypothetical protein
MHPEQTILLNLLNYSFIPLLYFKVFRRLQNTQKQLLQQP